MGTRSIVASLSPSATTAIAATAPNPSANPTARSFPALRRPSPKSEKRPLSKAGPPQKFTSSPATKVALAAHRNPCRGNAASTEGSPMQLSPATEIFQRVAPRQNYRSGCEFPWVAGGVRTWYQSKLTDPRSGGGSVVRIKAYRAKSPIGMVYTKPGARPI